ncbi:hypothetical protein LSTR_LSTR008988 [Laodelphax striatellus]|uniref:Uncharacterized protein n=1 Tax=Laodelphax striatellus TaxID=195883 RepID=A0A482WXL6_LAOST|nr:hypothetical protein LSTR_LSTR008988 [Laodelphax striatellus]
MERNNWVCCHDDFVNDQLKEQNAIGGPPVRRNSRSSPQQPCQEKSLECPPQGNQECPDEGVAPGVQLGMNDGKMELLLNQQIKITLDMKGSLTPCSTVSLNVT